MESSSGAPGVTVMAPEAPSSYHVSPRNHGPGSCSMVPVLGPPPGIVFGCFDKKKRGRPRKYAPEGAVSRPLSPTPKSSYAPPPPPPAAGGSFSPRPVPEKKQRAENPGDWISCTTGGNFLPHLITVEPGQDVTMKIISFSQQGPRAICIISANGLISNVTLRQPNSTGGTLTYEGHFEILSLSGSFAPAEFGESGTSLRGGMSISLASPDGRVVGGMLAGLLIAASPVQVVVGSFLPNNYGEPKAAKKPKGAAAEAAMPIPNSQFSAAAAQNLKADTKIPRVYTGTTTHSAAHTKNWGAMPNVDESRKGTTDINISLPESE